MTRRESSRPSPAPAKSRWFVIAAILGSAVVLATLFWRTSSRPPLPPEVELAGFDRPVADLIASSRARVLAQPDSAAAWGALGGVLLMNAAEIPAAECFGQAIRLAPSEPRWHYLRGRALLEERPDEALPDLLRAADLTANGPSAPKLAVADFLTERGRLEEADELLTEVLEHDPRDARALLGKARIADARGKPLESTGFLDRSIQSDPGRKPTWVLFAAALQRAGEVERANQALAMAATLPERTIWPDPFREELLKYQVSRLARRAQLQGLPADGPPTRLAEASEAVLKDYPDEPEAWRVLGVARVRLGDFAGSESAFKKAAELAPDSSRIQLDLALLMGIQQRFSDAAGFARAAISLSPDSAEARYSLGAALAALGDWNPAIAELEQAVALDPGKVQHLVGLGEALVKAGRPAEALVPLENALRLSPGNPAVETLLGRAREESP